MNKSQLTHAICQLLQKRYVEGYTELQVEALLIKFEQSITNKIIIDLISKQIEGY